MFRAHRFNKSIWLVPLLAMLILRMTGAHEHFCFDGMEPPVSIHFNDDAGMHDTDAGSSQLTADQPHTDVDVSLLGEALVKKLDANLDLPAIVSSILFVLFVVSAVVVGTPNRHNPLLRLSAARAHIRPQLRAPPR